MISNLQKNNSSNSHNLSNLPKEIIIEILTKVHESYSLKNLSLTDLEILQEKVKQELSSRKSIVWKEKWKTAFPDLIETIDQIKSIEEKRDVVILEIADVSVYIYPCSNNLYFRSEKYSECYHYHLHDEVDYNFPDYEIMKLVLTVYSKDYLF